MVASPLGTLGCWGVDGGGRSIWEIVHTSEKILATPLIHACNMQKH